MKMGRAALLALVVALPSAATQRPLLCHQAQIPTTPVLCSATIDLLLVADGSSSVQDIHSQVTAFMQTLTNLFALDTAAPDATPRVGIITFNGPPITSGGINFAEEQAARMLVNLTADTAAIMQALDTRPASQGLTCISCGLLLAQRHLAEFQRPGALGIVLVLTDGQQTIGGNDQTAIQYAANVRADGHTVYTIGFGEARQQVMEQMASQPAATYALNAYGLTSTCRLLLRSPRPPRLSPAHPRTTALCAGSRLSSQLIRSSLACSRPSRGSARRSTSRAPSGRAISQSPSICTAAGSSSATAWAFNAGSAQPC